MSNHEWDTLAAQWDGLEVGDPALLQNRLRRHVRWNRLGLLGEGFALLVALGLIAYVWSDAAEMRTWLIAAALALVFCQAAYVLLRQRYRLFSSPAGGLVGLIDAEIARARFVIATQWVGVAFGLAMLPMAWAWIPAEQNARLLVGGLVGAALVLPYMAMRTWQMLRRIRRLRGERVGLVE